MTTAAMRFIFLGAIVSAGMVAVRAVDEPAARSVPSRPSAPQLWPTTRLRGVDYVDVREIAKRFDLKPAWSKSEQEMTLADARGARFIFENGQYDFYFDGLRIFLGERVLFEKGSLFVTKLDVIKLVAPLFRPVDHLAQLPAGTPKVIVLDPGHGGVDPGMENKRLGLNEKTFTLDVALRLKKLLEAEGWRVLLTRGDDRELSKVKVTDLQMRDELARTNKADLFLSIHFNSVEKEPERVTGIETYTMSPQSMISTGEKKDDMTDTAFPSNKLDFANLLFGEELHRAMIATLKTPDRGFKRARKAVLRLLDCPGALVECAFLSNDNEARRVATPEFRQQIAIGLATGLRNYAAALEALRPAEAKPPAPAVPAAVPQPVLSK
jgi:N-acetylmuramoyl-L-alanine amidase